MIHEKISVRHLAQYLPKLSSKRLAIMVIILVTIIVVTNTSSPRAIHMLELTLRRTNYIQIK